MSRILRQAPLAVLLAAPAFAGANATTGDRPFDLMVGDPAPAIEAREWVQGDPVAAFEAGQVYVVEFWATWCGPCRKAIPHMSELSAHYGEKVEFIGVSVWENIDEENVYAVPAFVQNMGAKMSYTVASDRTSKEQEPVMATRWMTAAGQAGIPTAFIVDGAGRIGWIGSPFDIDEPLASIVAGEWDLEKATAKHAHAMAQVAAKQRAQAALREAKHGGEWKTALATLEEVLTEFPKLEESLAMDRYIVMARHGDAKAAAKYGRHAVKSFYNEDPRSLNLMAWSIVDPAARSESADLELAKLAAHRANELTGWKDPALLDTLGLALFLTGDHAKAIEIQSKAVEHAVGTPYEGELKARLEEFRAEVGTRS